MLTNLRNCSKCHTNITNGMLHCYWWPYMRFCNNQTITNYAFMLLYILLFISKVIISHWHRDNKYEQLWKIQLRSKLYSKINVNNNTVILRISWTQMTLKTNYISTKTKFWCTFNTFLKYRHFYNDF